MARNNTWIKGTAPEQPLSTVARKALKARLKLVRHYLPLAALQPGKDVEYVHQLRVATRRAEAALKVFSSSLPKKRTRKLRKQLKQIRHAAGEARNLDVLLARLRAEKHDSASDDLTALIREVRRERRRAQRPLRKLHAKLKQQGFRSSIQEFLSRIKPCDKDEPTLAEAAHHILQPEVSEFFSTDVELNTTQALHELRVRGKQLRYAMELLAGAYAASFRNELCPAVAEIQERLGEINDHVTAAQDCLRWIVRADRRQQREFLDQRLQTEQQQADTKSQQFRRWWTRARRQRLKQQFDQFF